MGKNGDDDSTDPREAQQMTGQSSWRTSRPSSATAPPTLRSNLDKTSPLSDMFKMPISSCMCECSNIFEGCLQRDSAGKHDGDDAMWKWCQGVWRWRYYLVIIFIVIISIWQISCLIVLIKVITKRWIWQMQEDDRRGGLWLFWQRNFARCKGGY